MMSWISYVIDDVTDMMTSQDCILFDAFVVKRNYGLEG